MSGPFGNADPPVYPGIDASVVHPARRYDYWLGGKDNFAVDRASAEEIARVFPSAPRAARENRGFLRRAVKWLVENPGIDQFLDIGTGLPSANNTHEVAQAINPNCRVVYVDNDPMLVVHARALLTSLPGAGPTSYLQADVRNPLRIIRSDEVRDTLDLDRPVALMLVAIMHFIKDSEDPYGIVQDLLEPLAPGSFLVMSHGSFDPLPAELRYRLEPLVTTGPAAFVPRTGEQIMRFFEGMYDVDPGLVMVNRWKPDPETDLEELLPPEEICTYGMVAAKGS